MPWPSRTYLSLTKWSPTSITPRRSLSPSSPVSHRSSFATGRSAMVEAKHLLVSEGYDPDTIANEVTALTERGGKWALCNDSKGLERGFHFKTFKATWDFMNATAAECKKQKHHPEWTNVYNRTHIRWTTHRPEGLSGKDTAMARFCDEVAREHGELEVEGDGGRTVEETRSEGCDACAGREK